MRRRARTRSPTRNARTAAAAVSIDSSRRNLPQVVDRHLSARRALRWSWSGRGRAATARSIAARRDPFAARLGEPLADRLTAGPQELFGHLPETVSRAPSARKRGVPVRFLVSRRFDQGAIDRNPIGSTKCATAPRPSGGASPASPCGLARARRCRCTRSTIAPCSRPFSSCSRRS